MSTALQRRPNDCASDLTIDRWLLGELPHADEGRRLEEHVRSCAQCGSRVRSLRELYATQRGSHRAAGVKPRVVPAPTTSPSQHGVAQVIIMRDGLLVGTEVFTPGEWFIGSDARCDLVLTDGTVHPRHARLVFRDGRAAIADLGGGLFVNGFKVTTAELRPIDELSCGPYVLRTRVIAERWGEDEQKTQVSRLRPIAPLGLAPTTTEPELRALPTPPPPPAAKPTLVAAPTTALQLELRLFWGDACQVSRVFAQGPVHAAERESAELPLWGFGLGNGELVLAEGDGQGFSLHVPEGAAIERHTARGWEPVAACASIPVDASSPVRLRRGPMILVAALRPAPAALPPRKLSAEALQVPALSAVLMVGLLAIIHFNTVEEPDFDLHPLPKALVKMSFPEKKTPPPPAQQTPADNTPAPPKVVHTPRPHPVSHHAPPPDSLEALARLRKGPLAAITKSLDKIGPSTRHGVASTNPLALPGSGATASVFGFNGKDDTGIGRKGLRDAGNLQTDGLGKGHVGGTVSHASASRVGGKSSSIDRDQVAKVINDHLGEVQRCYEMALLGHSKLAGRATLEWVITLNGDVKSARSKSSSLQSGQVESCILSHLKGWKFPRARGGDVTVSYPFVFDALDF